MALHGRLLCPIRGGDARILTGPQEDHGMGGKTIRGYLGDMKWARLLTIAAVVGMFTMLSVEPAFAFEGLATNIVGKATEVADAVKKILFAAAVVSVLAGAAPMLWGEVKVKWIVSALAACAVISMMGTLVNAFVNGG